MSASGRLRMWLGAFVLAAACGHPSPDVVWVPDDGFAAAVNISVDLAGDRTVRRCRQEESPEGREACMTDLRAGDTASRSVTLGTVCTNQDGEVVLEGEAVVLVTAHPEANP